MRGEVEWLQERVNELEIENEGLKDEIASLKLRVAEALEVIKDLNDGLAKAKETADEIVALT